MADGNFFGALRSGYAPRLADPFLTSTTSCSYADIDDRSARIASVLRANGVAAGDRVLVQLSKSVDAVALYLASLRVGAVYVPLNPEYTATETAFFVDDAEPAIFVGSANKHPSATPLDAILETAATAAPSPSVSRRSGDDVAALIYTSGTTGRPKGAMLTHANLATNAAAVHGEWGWQPGDVLLHALPIFHVHGLFVALHSAMLSGSEVIFLSRFDTAAVRASLPRATVMMGVPTFYHRLLSDPTFGAGDCASMRLFVSGSAPLTSLAHREFETRTGHQILERYGMSEAGMICSNPLDGARVPGTVGFPFAGYDTRIADGDDQPVAAHDIGMLQIQGPSLFAGYWGKPDATADSFTADGYFRTGDTASVDDDGRVTLHGRVSDVIISGGFNIYPKEIEMVLDGVDGVAESAVVAAPDDDLGEIVVAYVVLDAPIGEADLAHVAEEQLARFKQPRRYTFLDELPRNAMGKVQKAQLRAGP